MVQFMFMINQKKVEFQDIPDGPIKSSFEILKSALADRLGSVSCPTHHRSPHSQSYE